MKIFFALHISQSFGPQKLFIKSNDLTPTLLITFVAVKRPVRQVNTALLSRCRVFVLQKLATEVLEAILRRAISDNTGGLGATPLQVGCEAPSSSRFAGFGSV